MSNHGVYYTKSPLLASRTPIWRSRFIIFCLALGFTSLIARASWVQLFDYSHLQEEAEKRYTRVMVLHENRGEILDRNGYVLASSIKTPSIWASPADVVITDAQLQRLAQLLDMGTSELSEKLEVGQGSRRRFIWLKRLAGEGLAEQVMALGIKGIYVRDENRRDYPNLNVTAQLIGIVNTDNVGTAGLELVYDRLLTGEPGYRQYYRDRLGNIVAADEMPYKAAVDGKSVQLSIDRRIQYFAYEALENAVRDLQAESASVVVVDVITGEILAMTSYPSYNPIDRSRLNQDYMRNRAVTDVFEPGSIIKPVIAARALDLGIVRPDTVIQTARGSLVIGSKVIEDVGNYPRLTVAQILQKSSNIGITRIAMQMKPQEMWEALRALGFGESVHIGFPGEKSGVLRDYKTWKPIEQATQSYGYGFSTSLLQLARAYTAFARDGEIIPLTLLRNDTPVRGIPVFSAKTAQEMRDMLYSVIEEGGGTRARIEGYTAGGKSGTTRRLDATGNYSTRSYNALFVGLAPIHQPRIIVAVFIDSPNKNKEQGGYYGGVAAAPVFAEIAGRTLRVMGVSPDIAPVQSSSTANRQTNANSINNRRGT